ncbi:MAG: VOC family protein, partial [Parvularculaceae bacterium]|nr:VOC family protein [Parvularculaceae bacterium]
MTSYYRPKGLSSALSYLDPKRALLFLEEEFGFEPLMVIVDENDKVAHSEMSFGDSVVMVGSEWSEDHRSPK